MREEMQSLKDRLKSDIDKLEKIKNTIVKINSTYSMMDARYPRPSGMDYLKVMHDIDIELNMFKVFYSATMHDIILVLSSVEGFFNNIDDTMKLSNIWLYSDGLKKSTEELGFISEELNRFIGVVKDFQSISEDMCDLYIH